MSLASSRYRLSLRVIHGPKGIAVIGAVLFADMEKHERNGSIAASNASGMQWHDVVGLALLVLVIPRLVVRCRKRTPVIPSPGIFTALTARLVHAALYVSLLVEPALGWFRLSYGKAE